MERAARASEEQGEGAAALEDPSPAETPMIVRLALLALLVCQPTGCFHLPSLAADDLRAAEPAFLPPPPGHPFAGVEIGMGTAELAALLGPPTSLERVPTIWTFVPFYLGSEERTTIWRYEAEGRVLLSDHPRTGELEVIQVEYDPRERGV